MSRFLVAVLGALLVVAGGCQMSGEARGTGGSRDAQMMSADGCPHCQGKQTLRSDGTCPSCGQKMSAKMMSADACPHCEGVQTATADGKCAACEAKK